jgi:hypothetical protein
MKNATQTYETGKLRVGDVVMLREGGEQIEHIVVLVNDCRAACRPLARNPVSYETVGGKNINFDAVGRSVNIAPNSEVTILQRLGQAGLDEFLKRDAAKSKLTREQKKELAAERKAERLAKKEARKRERESGIRPKREGKGRLGLLLNHSVISVLRAMGRHGWDEWKAVRALKLHKIEASESTIKRALRKGSKGMGNIAPITLKQLETLLKK